MIAKREEIKHVNITLTLTEEEAALLQALTGKLSGRAMYDIVENNKALATNASACAKFLHDTYYALDKVITKHGDE